MSERDEQVIAAWAGLDRTPAGVVSVETVQRALADYFADEFAVEPFGEGRFVCEMPIYYPDGDSAAVFLIEQDGTFEVTDYGEGYASATERRGPRAPVAAAARDICAGLGLDFAAGRVSLVVRPDAIADAVWRVATASARIAEAVTFARAERGRDEDRPLREALARLTNQ